jgi:prefoldin subunit 5
MENRVDEAIKTTVTLGANAAATEKMAEALSSMDERLRTTNENIAELCGRIGNR